MANVPISNMTTTWTDSGTTYSGVKLNVTDTASASGSLLMDLQAGGTSKFKVDKTGSTTFSGSAQLPAGSVGSLALRMDVSTYGLYKGATQGGGAVITTCAGVGVFAVGQNNGIGVVNIGPYCFSTAINATADLILARDAANTLAQRNGTNAQTFRIYNTTDAGIANYERGFLKWDSNVLKIGTEKDGTGTARALELQTDGTTRLTIGSTGGISASNTITITPSSTSGYGVTVTGGGVGGNLRLRNGTGFGFIASSTLNYGWSSDADANSYDIALARSAAGVVKVTNGSTGGGSLEFLEQTAPSAPSADAVRIYAEDNGSGKTRLMALFPTGAAQQIAIEP